MQRLDCFVKNYSWGRRGYDSRVARLKRIEDNSYEVDEEENYAELWMGTHPSGPSRLKCINENASNARGMFLIELLETQPDVLGDLEEVGDLPFMFKILSIEKALSIQAHPDKSMAEKLYATRPDLYRDDNHKPEMAVALSEFEGLCGFRSFHEIVYSLHRYPELRGVVSLGAVKAILDIPEDIGRQRAALKKLFISYMTAKPAVIRTQIAAMIERLKQIHGKDASSYASSYQTSCQTSNSSSRNASIEPNSSRGDLNPTESSSRSRGNTLNSRGRSTNRKHVGVQGAFDPSDEFGMGYEPGTYSASGATYPIRSPQTGLSVESIFGSFFECEDEIEFEQMCDKIIVDGNSNRKTRKTLKRLRKEERAVQKLILRLNEEYPGDIGVMMPLLLNYIRLEPGQSFFMGANEPHAYLKGDLMEVMARSDNVVRVALTEKYRDVPLLCEILTYEMGAPPYILPRIVDPFCVRFTPPVPDFELQILELPDRQEYLFESIKVPSILLVLNGEGEATEENTPNPTIQQYLQPGVTIFVPARTVIGFLATSETPLRMALAHTNIHWRPQQLI